MSITLAAQDLCLTQSAVSRQIHALEEHVGTPLLIREHRSIRFTAVGERLFRSADGAVQQLQDVLGDIRGDTGPHAVTLSTTIGVTGLWLLPRLGRFQQTNPDLDLRVSANNRVSELRHDGVDLAIRYTDSASAPEGANRLFGETLAPVARPDLAESMRRNGKAPLPPLLEFDDDEHPWLQWDGWMNWIQSQKRPLSQSAGRLRFNLYDQVIRAALDGQGMAIGRMELIQPLLDGGRLQLLDEPRHIRQSNHAYWLILASATPRPEVRRVADWIVSEASRH